MRVILENGTTVTCCTVTPEGGFASSCIHLCMFVFLDSRKFTECLVEDSPFFMIISHLQTSCHTHDNIQLAHHLFNLLFIHLVSLVCLSCCGFICSSTFVISSLCVSPQDQTSQSTDPTRENPSWSPLCRAANIPLQAAHAPLIQTPNSELQTGPVLVE